MVQLLLALIYLAFISLGLPDSLLGAAWPSMYPAFGVPLSYAGILSMIIAAGTIFSSLKSDALVRKLGTGRVTVISVGTTAAAMLGFSFSGSFAALCLWAVPYGLGAGSVDASLNNYVALHYKSRHMSWLHCMWGVGATVGPAVMGLALSAGRGWNAGYRSIGLIQAALTLLLLVSLPLWKKQPGGETAAGEQGKGKPLSLREVLRIPGAREVMVCFFCYSAVEQTAGLWAGSYLTLLKGVSPEQAASFAGMFFLGITAGRAFSGFLTMKLSDRQMIRLGEGIILLGILAMALPAGTWAALGGLILIGLGCAPIFPCVIHSTPRHFGAERSQALIGVQMASSYLGTLTMPPLFGYLAAHTTAALLPAYLAFALLLMTLMHERLEKKAGS